jgi:hypothetical protein
MQSMERLFRGRRRLATALASLGTMLGGAFMLTPGASKAPASLSLRELSATRGGGFACAYTYSCNSGCASGAYSQWVGPDYHKCGLIGGGCTENGTVTCYHYTYSGPNCTGTAILDYTRTESSCT